MKSTSMPTSTINDIYQRGREGRATMISYQRQRDPGIVYCFVVNDKEWPSLSSIIYQTFKVYDINFLAAVFPIILAIRQK
jgi:hypothetical protein